MFLIIIIIIIIILPPGSPEVLVVSKRYFNKTLVSLTRGEIDTTWPLKGFGYEVICPWTLNPEIHVISTTF